MNGCGRIVLGIGIFLAIAMVWSAQQPDVGNKYGAADACAQLVRSRLKAPATADVPISDTVIDLDSSRYMVAGFYDAENSFGAKLRGKYACTVRYNAFTHEYALMTPLLVE